LVRLKNLPVVWMKKKIKFDEPRKTVKVEVPPQNTGFSNGFVLGALAGLAGFFLYGTKKGRKVKKRLSQELKKLGEEVGEIKDKITEEPAAVKKPAKKITAKKKSVPKKTAKKDSSK
jgi:hypothetical protein